MKNMKQLIKNISNWSMGTRLIIVIFMLALGSGFSVQSQVSNPAADAATIANAKANTSAVANQIQDYQERLSKVREAINTIRSFKNALEIIDLAQAVYCVLQDIEFLMNANSRTKGFDICRRQFQLDLQLQRLDMAVKEVEVALGSNKDLTTSDRVKLLGLAMKHLSQANNGLVNLRSVLKTRVRSAALDRYLRVKNKRKLRKLMTFSIYARL